MNKADLYNIIAATDLSKVPLFERVLADGVEVDIPLPDISAMDVMVALSSSLQFKIDPRRRKVLEVVIVRPVLPPGPTAEFHKGVEEFVAELERLAEED